MKTKITSAKITAWIMLLFGIIALITSIIYTSLILAFLGLGLIFWGTILTYIQTEEYIKKPLLDTTIQTTLTTLDQLIKELSYKGNAIYLPPKYFQEPETVRIYIPKQKTATVPSPEEIQKYEKQLLVQNPQGLLLTPLGAELLKLFEETLQTTFTKFNIEELQSNLQKLLIEDLEIAEDLEMQTELVDDAIYVKIRNTIYKNLYSETSKLPHVIGMVGCPLCSAIACALTKAIGKPIIIEKIQPFEGGQIIEAVYRVLETAEPREKADMQS